MILWQRNTMSLLQLHYCLKYGDLEHIIMAYHVGQTHQINFGSLHEMKQIKFHIFVQVNDNHNKDIN